MNRFNLSSVALLWLLALFVPFFALDALAAPPATSATDAIEGSPAPQAAVPQRVTLSTAIDAGVALAEPGGYVGRAPGAPLFGLTSPVLRLRAETWHANIGLGWDASAAFDIGHEPLFVMVNAGLGAVPGDVNGWRTGTALQFARASRSAETVLVARAGATRLDAERGFNRAGTTAAIAANDIGRWAYQFDVGVQFRWYGDDIHAVHATTAVTDPLVELHLGLRHDERFHRAGDLSPFTDPTGRVFFGFTVLPVRIAAPKSARRGRVLSAGGAFDYEGALRGSYRLPSGYRAAAFATLNLTRLSGQRP